MNQLFLFNDDDVSDVVEPIDNTESIPEVINESTKVCRICNQTKNVEDFFLDRGKPYSKCKDCFSEYQKDLREAKKNAPPKPDKCECCGRIPEKWVCDHYPKTDIFRGWVCSDCNLASGYMGDTYEGAVKLVNYLYTRKSP